MSMSFPLQLAVRCRWLFRIHNFVFRNPLPAKSLLCTHRNPEIWTRLFHCPTRRLLAHSSDLAGDNVRRATQHAVEKRHARERQESGPIRDSDHMKWSTYSPDEHSKHVKKIGQILGFEFTNPQLLWGVLQWQPNEGPEDLNSRITLAWQGSVALKLALRDKAIRDGKKGKNQEFRIFLPNYELDNRLGIRTLDVLNDNIFNHSFFFKLLLYNEATPKQHIQAHTLPHRIQS